MDKHWKQLEDFAKAEKHEWNRLVVNNIELQADLHELKNRFGFPRSIRDYENWFSREREQRYKFSQELGQIMKKHGIRERWFSNLANWIVVEEDYRIGPGFSYGLPQSTFSQNENGKWKSEIILDSTVDINNPVVRRFIEEDQRQAGELWDPPPQPQPSKENPRKQDWSPVWEWHKRHPNTTITRLARLLNRSRSSVAHKLGEFED